MMWSLKCILLFVVSLQLAKVNSEEGFNNFLTIAMQGYPAWVASNGLEPSPIIPDSINITRSSQDVSITGEIRNQQIFNYTNVFVEGVSSDVEGGTFSFHCEMPNLAIIGEYDVIGNVFTTIPVTGSGAMNIRESFMEALIDFHDFGVTADGFVDLSVATYNVIIELYMATADFEGLSAGGFESNVAEFIRTVYRGSNHGRWVPVAKHIQIYLGELFEKTPLSEIIGTTLTPPPTTTPPTTCPPSETAGPRFSRTSYQTVLPAWPTQGHSIDMGIRASSPGGCPLQFELVTPFPFVELTDSQHINFTADISQGVHVGPNNVMVLEVVAEEIDGSARFGSATVVIIFPRGCLADEN